VDLNTTAYRIVNALTEEKTEEAVQRKRAKSKAGRAGGAARTKTLSAQRRIEIARSGSVARWGKDPHGQ
jgi:hypothetical protein